MNESTTPHRSVDVFGIVKEADIKTDWIIEGIWPAEDSLMVYGASGSGKSYLVADMSLHVAFGMDWHGFKVPDARKVLYVPSEGRRGTARRLRAWLKYNDWVGADLEDEMDVLHQEYGDQFGWYMTPSDFELDLADSVSVGHLRDELETLQPDIVIFDVFKDFAPGLDENERKMGHLVKSVGFDKIGATPLMVHHTGHNALERPRGHSSIIGANDVQIAVQADILNDGLPNQLTTMKLTNTKQKNESKFAPLSASLTIPSGSDLEYPVITGVLATLSNALQTDLTEGQLEYLEYALQNMGPQGQAFTPSGMREATGFSASKEASTRKALLARGLLRTTTVKGQVPHLVITDEGRAKVE